MNAELETMQAELTARTASLAAAEQKNTTLTKENERLSQQLSAAVIDGQIEAQALSMGVLPGALVDVLERGKKLFRVDPQTGRAVMWRDGVQIESPNGGPMNVENWLTTLKNDAPYFFRTRTASGGQSGPIVLSREDARDPIVYGRARAEAERLGTTLEISDKAPRKVSGGRFVLSREQARDPLEYRRMKSAAEAEGQTLVIED